MSHTVVPDVEVTQAGSDLLIITLPAVNNSDIPLAGIGMVGVSQIVDVIPAGG